MAMSQVVKMMLTKLDWYGTLFPRIPVPIQKEIELKFREKTKLDYQREHGDREPERDRRRTRSRSRDRIRVRSKERERDRERSRDRDRTRGRSRENERPRERARDSKILCVAHPTKNLVVYMAICGSINTKSEINVAHTNRSGEGVKDEENKDENMTDEDKETSQSWELRALLARSACFLELLEPWDIKIENLRFSADWFEPAAQLTSR
ncbi:unnamed protein product [Gongylonema pulchrum]|uniref:Pre-mRNA-splicing factor 38 n=1 Tax=Gongylonema pulchrum TaxID=637853 RepID=A0A183EI62_9BILA|nr:unnamed protein product [Gongylonema pulchrum]